jgi:hypothetical protein
MKARPRLCLSAIRFFHIRRRDTEALLEGRAERGSTIIADSACDFANAIAFREQGE